MTLAVNLGVGWSSSLRTGRSFLPHLGQPWDGVVILGGSAANLGHGHPSGQNDHPWRGSVNLAPQSA
ncbi:MAG TPA: hypothetical protein VIY29_04245, partial [Ktedonobacteraceae bacterium]